MASKRKSDEPDDARAKKVRLACPGCNGSSRAIETTYDATDFFVFRCRNRLCGRLWQVKLTPTRANREMVVRTVEWTELLREEKP